MYGEKQYIQGSVLSVVSASILGGLRTYPPQISGGLVHKYISLEQKDGEALYT